MSVRISVYVDYADNSTHFTLTDGIHTASLELDNAYVYSAQDSRALIANEVQGLFNKWESSYTELPAKFKDGIMYAIFQG